MLIMQRVKAIVRSEKGQGMVEYGLILALIAVVAIAGMSLLGGGLTATLASITAKL